MFKVSPQICYCSFCSYKKISIVMVFAVTDMDSKDNLSLQIFIFVIYFTTVTTLSSQCWWRCAICGTSDS